MQIEGLTISQWRKLFDTLCDGEQDAALPLTYMRQFKDCIPMYFWLRKNRIEGKKLVEFFREKGNLGAVKYMQNKIWGNKHFQENLKVSDLV